MRREWAPWSPRWRWPLPVRTTAPPPPLPHLLHVNAEGGRRVGAGLSPSAPLSLPPPLPHLLHVNAEGGLRIGADLPLSAPMPLPSSPPCEGGGWSPRWHWPLPVRTTAPPPPLPHLLRRRVGSQYACLLGYHHLRVGLFMWTRLWRSSASCYACIPVWQRRLGLGERGGPTAAHPSCVPWWRLMRLHAVPPSAQSLLRTPSGDCVPLLLTRASSIPPPRLPPLSQDRTTPESL